MLDVLEWVHTIYGKANNIEKNLFIPKWNETRHATNDVSDSRFFVLKYLQIFVYLINNGLRS